jgi:serine/threonine-protein kinase RsbW
MPDISITVPARPEFVHIMRSVVASAAARVDFTYDEIDDVRLALDEACAQLLAAGAGTTLSMSVRIAVPNELEIVTSIDAQDHVWPPPGAENTLAWQVLSALTDDARYEHADGRPALRLIKRRQPAGDRP